MKKLQFLVLLLLIYSKRGCSAQSLPCHTASGDNCTSSICPNTVVNYTCTISGTPPGGYTDWILPTDTCPLNLFSDKIRISQFVTGRCSPLGPNTCGPYTASSVQSSDPTYCLSSILTANITSAMNGSTVPCSNTDDINASISTVVSSATINVIGPPGAPSIMANTIGPGMVQVVVNPSSSGDLPTSYIVTISNSSYVYSNTTPAFPNGSAMIIFTGLTNSSNYTISSVAINNCSALSLPTTKSVSFPSPRPPSTTASITTATLSASITTATLTVTPTTSKTEPSWWIAAVVVVFVAVFVFVGGGGGGGVCCILWKCPCSSSSTSHTTNRTVTRRFTRQTVLSQDVSDNTIPSSAMHRDDITTELQLVHRVPIAFSHNVAPNNQIVPGGSIITVPPQPVLVQHTSLLGSESSSRRDSNPLQTSAEVVQQLTLVTSVSNKSTQMCSELSDPSDTEVHLSGQGCNAESLHDSTPKAGDNLAASIEQPSIMASSTSSSDAVAAHAESSASAPFGATGPPIRGCVPNDPSTHSCTPDFPQEERPERFAVRPHSATTINSSDPSMLVLPSPSFISEADSTSSYSWPGKVQQLTTLETSRP